MLEEHLLKANFIVDNALKKKMLHSKFIKNFNEYWQIFIKKKNIAH